MRSAESRDFSLVAGGLHYFLSQPLSVCSTPQKVQCNPKIVNSTIYFGEKIFFTQRMILSFFLEHDLFVEINEDRTSNRWWRLSRVKCCN